MDVSEWTHFAEIEMKMTDHDADLTEVSMGLEWELLDFPFSLGALLFFSKLFMCYCDYLAGA